MSSLHKQTRKIEKGDLTLALNAAEGRLQLVLGRAARSAGPAHAHKVAASVAPAAQNDNEPEILAAQDWQAVAQGAELLAPALDQMLRNLKLEASHIGRVAAVVGPGGFTGLRLATVTASALARGLGAQTAALEYLPLLAAGAAEVFTSTVYFWVTVYARRDLIYVQSFARDNSGPDLATFPETGPESGWACAQPAAPAPGQNPARALKPMHPLSVLRPAELPELLGAITAFNSALCSNTIVLGSGLGKNFSVLEPELSRTCPGLNLASRCLDYPAAATLLRAALAADYSRGDLTPLYVRPSDAEENLPQIAAGLGLNRDYARQRLEELLNEKV